MGNARVTTFCRKAFTTRFIAEFRTSNTWILRSDDATVDVLGVCLYASPLLVHDAFALCYPCYKGYYIHIGVGFDVAYLSEKASSKARNAR